MEARAEEEKEGRRKSKSSTLTKEVAELLACETGILNKLLRLMEDKVLSKAVEKFGSDLETLAEVDEVFPKERFLVESFNLGDIVLDLLLHLPPASLIADQTLQHCSHLTQIFLL